MEVNLKYAVRADRPGPVKSRVHCLITEEATTESEEMTRTNLLCMPWTIEPDPCSIVQSLTS
jgi:hypothetical protein